LISFRLPDLRTVIMIGDHHFPGTFKFSEVLASSGPQEVLKVQHMQDELQFDDPINIQFTSVSTGSILFSVIFMNHIVTGEVFFLIAHAKWFKSVCSEHNDDDGVDAYGDTSEQGCGVGVEHSKEFWASGVGVNKIFPTSVDFKLLCDFVILTYLANEWSELNDSMVNVIWCLFNWLRHLFAIRVVADKFSYEETSQNVLFSKQFQPTKSLSVSANCWFQFHRCILTKKQLLPFFFYLIYF